MLGTLSTLFGKIVARRNRKFDSGRGVVHVNVPVISVGNLSVGGTGKTPIVQMIVRLLQSMGHRPAVILRGYRRATRGHLLVHDGTTLLANAREAGDEAVLHATVLQVPVVVDEHKVDAAVFAAGMLPCDVI
ncbi:MAG: tetraacyldisaccharide 4'-kinase, partial [Ignavibacteriae bacterium]